MHSTLDDVELGTSVDEDLPLLHRRLPLHLRGRPKNHDGRGYVVHPHPSSAIGHWAAGGWRKGDNSTYRTSDVSCESEHQGPGIRASPHDDPVGQAFGDDVADSRLEVPVGGAEFRRFTEALHRAVLAAVGITARTLIPGDDAEAVLVEPRSELAILTTAVRSTLVELENERRRARQVTEVPLAVDRHPIGGHGRGHVSVLGGGGHSAQKHCPDQHESHHHLPLRRMSIIRSISAPRSSPSSINTSRRYTFSPMTLANSTSRRSA